MKFEANIAAINVTFTSPSIIRIPDYYPTIQTAINAASPGDTILVAPGTYKENLLVNKSVSIIGENFVTTIIDGEQKGTRYSCGII